MLLGSQHFGGRRACWSFRMRLGRMTSNQSLTHTCTNQTTSWLMHNQSTFGARTSHGQTQTHKTHKTHHDPDLGKPPSSSLQYTLCLATGPALKCHGTSTKCYLVMGLTPKCHFVLGLPSGSFEISKVGIPTTLGAHNFVCKPPIEMRFKEKLQPLLRAFQRYVAHHLHIRKLRRFLTFNGWESNCQFDSSPFFSP